MTDTPTGPALAYTSAPDADGTSHITRIDLEAVTDPRERAICKALLFHALRLLEASEATSAIRRP
ncbi:hypothetical protein [Streptomyces griseofuscus]|uniref:hypothetical protein n=1 Tax=Streptomyces griseofuscus TaxID=146922 RepID=UPI0033DAB631